MKLLEERIRQEGIVKSGSVLKVDSFINHQMDVLFFDKMGAEFKRLYADAPINKILTIEPSLPACTSVCRWSLPKRAVPPISRTMSITL